MEEVADEQITPRPVAVDLPTAQFLEWRLQQPELGYSRALRYFACFHLLKIRAGDHVVDVGGGRGSLARAFERNGATCTLIDPVRPRVQYATSVIESDLLDLDPRRTPGSRLLFEHTFEHFPSPVDLESVDWACHWLRCDRRRVCLILPLFVGKHSVVVDLREAHSNASLHAADRQDTDLMGSNFPGSPLLGMGFARVYSPETLSERVIKRALAQGVSSTVLTLRLGGVEMPDMRRYEHKNPALNFPLRGLLLRATSVGH